MIVYENGRTAGFRDTEADILGGAGSRFYSSGEWQASQLARQTQPAG